MMKRILFFCVVAVMAAGCFGDDPTTQINTGLVADFEYDIMDYDAKFGSDSLYFDSQYGFGLGVSYLAFMEKLDEGKSMLEGGFMFSYLAAPKSENVDGLENNRWRAYAAPTSYRNSYLVFRQNPDEPFMPAHDVEFTAVKYGTCTMNTCQMTNTVEVAKAVAEKFEKGDKLVVKATGYLDGQKTKTVECVLADFSAQKDSIVTKWTSFDLSALGNFQYVDFKVESTKPDIPAYFCLDKFSVSISLAY